MAEIFPNTFNPHQLDFGLQSHSHPALSFGFGRSSLTPLQQQFAAAAQPSSRPSKRRLEDEPTDEMDARASTPEPIRRMPLKRRRASPSAKGDELQSASGDRQAKVDTNDSDQTDIGIMLAMLPQQSFLPLLLSLVKAQPEIKPTLISLMPRPSLDLTLRVLNEAATKLRQAHPYSSNQFSSSSTLTQRNSLNSGQRGSIPTQMHAQSRDSFRDSYMQTRVAPYIKEFVTTVTSSLPFFTLDPSAMNMSSHALRQVKVHPSETFTFLATVTRIVLSMPPSTQVSLQGLLVSRLLDEWNMWLERVDEVVNKERGMFGQDAMKTWEKQLDELASLANNTSYGLERMKDLRDRWLGRVGWLLGRTSIQYNMMDDEEL